MMETFTVHSSELIGRIEPKYYRPLFRQLESRLRKLPVKSKYLKRYITQVDTGKNIQQVTASTDTVPYIRTQNVRPLFPDMSDITYVLDNSELKKTEKGDILFVRVGVGVGDVCVIPDNEKGCAFSDNVLRVRITPNINPYYVATYLATDIGSQLFKRTMKGSGKSVISRENLDSILIPILSNKSQNQIVKLTIESYEYKKQKESEANELLGSIYDYAVKELDLNYNIKIRKTFTISSNETNDRIDPLYYTIPLYDFLKTCKWEINTIGEISEYLKTGFAAGKSDQDLTGNGIIQIRPTNITEDRQFMFGRNVYIEKDKLVEKRQDILVKGEVLFNNTNSQEQVGKTIFFNLDGDYFCSNHITRIKVKDDEVLQQFLALILNIYQKYGLFFRICTNWNNQSGVNSSLLETLKIPLPKIEEQERIVKEVESKRNKAFQLRKEALQDLEDSKAEVEKLILGGQ